MVHALLKVCYYGDSEAHVLMSKKLTKGHTLAYLSAKLKFSALQYHYIKIIVVCLSVHQ